MIIQEYMRENWFLLLKEKIKTLGVRKAASQLGYSPTAVSLVLSGKYKGGTSKMEEAVIKTFSVRHCPYLGLPINVGVCEGLSSAPAPTHNPLKMAQWKACQSCPKRCDKQAA